MPLLFKRPAGEGFLALWHGDESTETLLSKLELSPAEQTCYDRISHQSKRRKEWLVWHVMVREFLGKGITTDYNESGQPVLVNHPGHISVSHAGELVALYYQPEPCGIDIENRGRNFDRVSKRYISEDEWKLCEADQSDRFRALMWCVKEAAYKIASKPGLSLLEGIEIRQINFSKSLAEVFIAQEKKIYIRYEFLEDHCLAYTFSR